MPQVLWEQREQELDHTIESLRAELDKTAKETEEALKISDSEALELSPALQVDTCVRKLVAMGKELRQCRAMLHATEEQLEVCILSIRACLRSYAFLGD